ncbi:MAG TPA: alpha/beta hydrolase family protein [Bryobacteraceae bacterium]|nr:alpha/beta hydrolase family protein [Bryobacteraceae bacterium]
MIRQVGSVADDLFRSWINARELRLAQHDNAEICAFDWGAEALESVSGFESLPGLPELDVFREANQRWLRDSAGFFAYQTPSEFQLSGAQLRFASAVKSLYSENDTVFADYFQCRQARGRAVLVLPHWNAALGSYTGFCRFLNWLGLSALLITLPYHGNRRPRQCVGAEYSISPNIGRTIACARQGVIDTLCCLDWLEQQGYEQFGIVGTSLGFGHAFVASALDQRLTANVFNHCCSTVSDALWAGMPQYRAALQLHISQRELRECWSVINPISYFDQFARLPKHSLLILARYDTTFTRDFVEEAIRPFRAMALDHQMVELPCGHRTIGDAPYALLSAYYIGAFLKKHLR